MKSIVHVCSEPVNMNLSFKGLRKLIGEHLQSDCRSGDWFLFFNTKQDYVKALWFDGTGFNIHSKKLEFGQFEMPKCRVITRKEFDRLLLGSAVVREEQSAKSKRERAA